MRTFLPRSQTKCSDRGSSPKETAVRSAGVSAFFSPPVTFPSGDFAAVSAAAMLLLVVVAEERRRETSAFQLGPGSGGPQTRATAAATASKAARPEKAG